MIVKKVETGMLPTNTYVVTDEATKGSAIIDPGEVEPVIEKYIEENGLVVESIILTHGHSDHMGGALYYKDKYKAVLYVHEADRPLLEDAGLNASKLILERAVTLKADVYVKEGDEICVGNLRFRVIHTPGHTPGGICLLSEDVLFSGDTLFYQSVGRTDFPFSDTNAMLAAIQEKLYVLADDTKVYPGHMHETTIGHEKMYNPFVGPPCKMRG